MTLQEISDATGLSVPTISCAENGKNLQTATAKVLCAFYNVPAEDMMLPLETESDDAA